MSSFNDSLLTKWLWKCINLDSPFSQLIRSIYGTNRSILSMEVTQSKSNLTKSILTYKDYICQHTTWTLGKGSAIRFWEDRWLGALKLRHMFPRCYNKALNKECLVNSQGFWLGNEWRWRVLLSERRSSMDEYNELLKLLQGIAPSLDLDKPRWDLSSTGIFTVNSLYKRITMRGINFGSYNQIWRSILPLKVKVFQWLLTKNYLQTKGNLILKNWNGDPRCVFCYQSVETTDHIFATCHEIGEVWKQLPLNALGLSFPCQGIDLQTKFTVSQVNDMHNLLLPTMCWTIWKERNRVIFRDGILDAKGVVNSTIFFLNFWTQNSASSTLGKTKEGLKQLKPLM